MSGLADFAIEGVDVAQRALAGWIAQAAPEGAASGFGTTIIFVVVMLAIFYLLMWRPQSKQYKAHQAMVAALKKGDEVLLLNGILGKVHEVGDKFIVLEVARDVRIRVLSNAITAKMPDSSAGSSGGSEG